MIVSSRLSISLFATGVIVVGSITTHALADSTEESAPKSEMAVCAEAFEQSQVLRNASRYLEAREQAIRCANEQCGDALFQECARIYEELERATPSVVFGARAPDNRELIDVVVTIDGKPTNTALDGKPVQIDPGPHQLTFTTSQYAPIERQVLIRTGDKYRQVSVVFAENAAEVPTPAPPLPSPEPEAGSREVPILTYVFGSVGVVALGGFVAFRVAASNDYDKLHDSCAPDCTPGSVDTTRRKYTLSFAALGLSAAAFGAAAAMYFIQPGEASPPRTTAFLGPTAGGMAGGVRTSF